MTVEQLSPIFVANEQHAGGPMSKLGNYDSLTGLLCRSAFEVDKASPEFAGRISAVFMINFDQFSKVNREHGRSVGDFLLAMSADRLSNLDYSFRKISYRYEGDRFVQLVLSDSPLNKEQLESIAKDIQCQLQRQIRLSDRSVELSCTVTAATISEDLPLNRIVSEALLFSAELKYKGPGQLHILCSDDGAESRVS